MGTYWHLCHFSDCAGHDWKTYETAAKKIQTHHQTTSDKQPGQTYNNCSQRDHDEHYCEAKMDIPW